MLYSSVHALRFEPVHTRLLLWVPGNQPFWSPPCTVEAGHRESDGRVVGTIRSRRFTPDCWLNIVNMVAVDYDRMELCKLNDFTTPIELPRGKEHQFTYEFNLRGRNERPRRTA